LACMPGNIISEKNNRIKRNFITTSQLPHVDMSCLRIQASSVSSHWSPAKNIPG
jgi:hypothetical protein